MSILTHLCFNGSDGPSSASPPTPIIPPPSHPLLHNTHDITGVVKNYLKNQQWILCGRVCYETLAIKLLYIYSKSGVATMQHKSHEPQLLQHFKVIFLEIQNLQIRTVFVNPVTNNIFISMLPKFEPFKGLLESSNLVSALVNIIQDL